MIRTFRKKPIEIKAVQWDGTEKTFNEIVLLFLADGHSNFEHLPRPPDDTYVHNGIGVSCESVFIPTLEGTMETRPGDWIIKGIKGEFYPCKPEIFELTYEEVI